MQKGIEEDEGHGEPGGGGVDLAPPSAWPLRFLIAWERATASCPHCRSLPSSPVRALLPVLPVRKVVIFLGRL
ncbi:hypothetical protein PR202_gb22265 [Eleusine coracana subsp. coracana]|uniref:Uncharacterized protein n=1 Tax=Eleusine coracana subsp. coracana TaxID=191504 RepID=A0AAV5FD45_ELECO|nr:hypothetical protein PR202_gb22265 [Eleusine coracana subsp. coracana]